LRCGEAIRAVQATGLEMPEAMHEVTTAEILYRRHFRPAPVDSKWAARGKEAAFLQIDRAWDFSALVHRGRRDGTGLRVHRDIM
jgi:hypothetical protein